MDMDSLSWDIKTAESEIARYDRELADYTRRETEAMRRLGEARSESDRASRQRELDYVMRNRRDCERKRTDASKRLQQLNQRQRERAKEQADKERRKKENIAAAATAAGAVATLFGAFLDGAEETKREKEERKRAEARRPARPTNNSFAKNWYIILIVFGVLILHLRFGGGTSNDTPVEKETPAQEENQRLDSLDTPQDNDVTHSIDDSPMTVQPTQEWASDEWELARWIGMPAGNAIDKFGPDYQTEWFRGQYFYYEEGCPYQFYYDDALSAPDSSTPIIAVSTGEKGTLVVYGIHIGDSIETVCDALGTEIKPVLYEVDELQYPCVHFCTINDEEYSLYFNLEGKSVIYAQVKSSDR